jgi:hypothetical protein
MSADPERVRRAAEPQLTVPRTLPQTEEARRIAREAEELTETRTRRADRAAVPRERSGSRLTLLASVRTRAQPDA